MNIVTIKLQYYTVTPSIPICNSFSRYINKLIIYTYRHYIKKLLRVINLPYNHFLALFIQSIYNPMGIKLTCLMDQKIQEAVATIKNLRTAVSTGSVPYSQAKNLAVSHLEILNNKAKEIAKKHNRKPLLITFAGFRSFK